LEETELISPETFTARQMMMEFKREDTQMDDVKRILVVSRSTKHCKKAVNFGISLAKQTGAKLYVLHVFDDPFGLEAWSLPVVSLKEIQEEYEKMQDRARSDLNRLIKAEENTGIPIEVSFEDGDPDEKILHFVKDKNIDLLIMLAHEEGRFEHLLFGRSIDRIIRKLPCSVMLVKKEPERAK
jgi:universal stress protein A